MNLMVNIDIRQLPRPINYRDKLLLVGSCFTEHIGNALQDMKFTILQNPNGILFDPESVCKSLVSYIENKKYTAGELFQLNEIWNSWQHHSRFSAITVNEALEKINASQEEAHAFLKKADWIVITLGSSFSYRLSGSADRSVYKVGDGVANCHRAPAQWFEKRMLAIDTITAMLDDCYKRLMQFNPGLNIIFTVSPVRHIRDGVTENNRSKARLIESVHQLVNTYSNAHYFPAYELVIDVLRDYRFYDIDLAHPNYLATEFVLEKFTDHCIDADAQQLMQEIKKIMIARRHKAFQPETKAHQQFLFSHFEKAKSLQEKHPFIDLSEEIVYFSQT